ncbi:recombinase family protein [Kitasatospora sp. NPDC048296]|uniref:recombinase family protein n=1 Tax=Kitasatospora sp. NPDC048296 TaxID=3364048 RepID=UPI00371FB80D
MFAFCGRVSTEDQQDPVASRAWQLARARNLIEPSGGRITAEYFDVGHSRSLPWKRRPQSASLLAALADPDRGFDAVVIGEPQRAFYGNQFGNTFPLFTHFGVQLWVPEVGGPIDPENEAHDLIMSVFGGMSKGERNRIRVRVRSSMGAQARHEGRFLGGRPPYGYRLVDLGPHPNPAKAADGRMLRGLEPDPTAAPVVQRIYREYLLGLGIFSIAEGLTSDGIPCPSAHDPARNSHRSGIAWSKQAVRVILTNPRYTGHQVWNKQRKDETLIDIEDVTLGYATTLRWNTRDKWIVSDKIVHQPLVDDETFAQVQDVFAVRAGTGTAHVRHRTRHLYLHGGALHCGICERRMQGQHSREDAYYRCRFPTEYGLANHVQHPRNVYLRGSWIIAPLDRWIGTVFAPHRLSATIEAMANAAPGDSCRDLALAERAREEITDCAAKLATHRAALEAGADPKIVAGWMAETQARQAAADRARTAPFTDAQPTIDEIAALVRQCSQLAGLVADAEPAEKSAVYRSLGIHLTYDPAKAEIRVEARPGTPALASPSARNDKSPRDSFEFPWGFELCPRGDLNPHAR